MPLNILWLVAARSGSKGIPDKNVRLLGGIPLLGWRIKSALPLPGRVWISTDSEKYAQIAREQGAEAPFIRPPELSGDSASSVDVCLHAMRHVENLGLNFDALCLLQPTSPFVSRASLAAGAEMLEEDREAEGVVAVREMRPSSFLVQPESIYLERLAANLRQRGQVNRQSFAREITPSGGFYFARWESFRRDKTFYGAKTRSFLLGDMESVDIDEPLDWLWAEFLLERNLVSFNYITAGQP